jgi:hypothetical protein
MFARMPPGTMLPFMASVGRAVAGERPSPHRAGASRANRSAVRRTRPPAVGIRSDAYHLALQAPC